MCYDIPGYLAPETEASIVTGVTSIGALLAAVASQNIILAVL
jgi:hypothetical protein